MIRCNRRVVREMGEIDPRTRHPIVMILEAGGRLVSLRAKGSRKCYQVAVKDIWILGAKIMAQTEKLAKIAKRKERKANGHH
jgi:hypothetical protein